MDFAEYLRKPDVSEKVYYSRYLQNGLYKSIVILVTVDEMNKKSASFCLLVER